MNWLAKISITCFVASYLVVLAIELLRIYMPKSAIRSTIRIGFAAAGLFAHSVYLAYHTNLSFDQSLLWFGGWFGWSLAGAWLLAAAYLWLVFQKPNSSIGLFLLPVVLGLIGWGTWLGSESLFTADREKTIWNMVHGISLLLGTAVVALGFVFGIMYLVHARRLKSKSLSASGQFRLPSLEWLHQQTERSLLVSAVFLGLGLLSGIALNLTETPEGIVIPWRDPVIWSSAALFGWLTFSCLGSRLYQPARSGRKVALLVLLSFLFLVIELGIVWSVGHGTGVSP
ncbi:hypothetical protein [Mariniblastus fucicola]|uniref:Cytochrome C assembly protein n=1 Tax=Mariniblastus fucicola TaxID=980251 RepID=A0A5B9P5Q4_9BACT|nr:hypothetical protein [Mariniblastus fucicola]QEG20250.1 hypothetical protein MFFC18_00970 [Mariniblastus fucicola]